MNRLAIYLVIAFSGWNVICHGQMKFNTNQTGNSVTDAVFADAASTWASEFYDDITVTVHYGFLSLDEGTISTAESGTLATNYTDFWNAIGGDITTDNDRKMFNGLPTGTSFSVYINQTKEASGAAYEVPYVDNDGGANNSKVILTSANAKALGLQSAHSPTIDGNVFFNSNYAWDFDPSDGIEKGHLDFFGTALHEIGHTLGFESGVDGLDGNGGGEFSDEGFPFVTSLDFLRHSWDSQLAGADIDWTADDRDKYLSIDGGLTEAISGGSHWSTGEIYGDGEQASHWKDGLNLGLMSPTTDFGLINSVSSVDLLALDVIGYDRGFSSVPEPSGLLGMLLMGLLWLRRRRSLSIA